MVGRNNKKRPVAGICLATGRFLLEESMSLTELIDLDGEVIIDSSEIEKYRKNPYTQETTAIGLPIDLVFAESVADIQNILKLANEHKVPVGRWYST